MGKCFFLLFLTFLLFFTACKTPPPEVQEPPAAPFFAPEQTPVSILEFERIEADSVDRIRLYYRLKTENPRPGPLDVAIQDQQVLLNGLELDDAVLTLDGIAAPDARISAGPRSSSEKNLVLELDLAGLPDSFMPEDEYRAGLSLDLAYCYANAEARIGAVSVETAFPRIREPVFTISSIAILQAELINTRFRVSLRIDNPNPFPVALSAFGYELYGEGRFWADGKEQNVLHVPAQSSAETSLSLIMNFINMKRHLLDEIIAMRQVRYRFTGEAEVGTGVSWLPSFRTSFDRSGNSAVLK